MKEIIFNVEGMHCESCENRIQNRIKELNEVESVVANHNDGTVKVTLNKNIERKIILDILDDMGFLVKEEQ